MDLKSKQRVSKILYWPHCSFCDIRLAVEACDMPWTQLGVETKEYVPETKEKGMGKIFHRLIYVCGKNM